MTTYTQLSEDEKNAIADGAIRNLEYQMYSIELEVIAENAKSNPDSERLTVLNNAIAEKQAQIAAVKA